MEKWKAMPMLGSMLWGVKDNKGVVIVLGLSENHARLIAAAPDLLAACKEARNLILDLEQAGAIDNPEEFHILRRVIAKAKAVV